MTTLRSLLRLLIHACLLLSALSLGALWTGSFCSRSDTISSKHVHTKRMVSTAWSSRRVADVLLRIVHPEVRSVSSVNNVIPSICSCFNYLFEL